MNEGFTTSQSKEVEQISINERGQQKHDGFFSRWEGAIVRFVPNKTLANILSEEYAVTSDLNEAIRSGTLASLLGYVSAKGIGAFLTKNEK